MVFDDPVRTAKFSLALAILLVSLPVSGMAQGVDKAAVEGIVKDYLLNNPEVVVDALNAFQEKKVKQAQASAEKVIQERKKELTEDKSAPSVGPKNADVVVVQFSDYHCGYCKRMMPVIRELLKQDKKLRIVFREFPILSEDSELAAKAALAVYQLKPDQYFAYHTALMNASGKFDIEGLKAQAQKLGVDPKKLEDIMQSKDIELEIRSTAELARALGINGTPAFVVNDQLLPGALDLEAMKKAVAEARGKKS